MEYTKLGNTGLDVSKICLGAMSFGDPVNWIHKWVLEEADSRPIIKGALDLGINFFDTANVYSIGRSEEILGAALKDYAKRDEIVLATKVHQKMFDGPNGGGLSRKHIMSQIDQSLKRLQTDYVDLYIIHRWDYNTPIEETMAALHDVVKSGKARYIGASAMHAYQFQKANYIAEKNGWTKFVSMQNHLNLIYREEEREMIPYCESEGIALTPYSPLASGRLARSKNESSKRLVTDEVARSKYDETADKDQLIIDRVGELASRYGVSRVEISLAWLFSKPTLAAPVIGATKMSHVETAVKATGIVLDPADIAYLEEPYVPHRIVGFE
ncbi:MULTISPECIES: aldo/keto reductase [unclassified Enterococcus]|uniref:aldo/keto reductase n=1 Tax=unclassified Enterococcus TaxID=2608891 RepID=UPI001908BB97|nr:MULTISPECIES: aldo/keto reductase [unclassified Enterococcus]MBK0038482.1 aldo/keto reductase [Enterococcus sp. S52]MBK0071412.1 aldo/keto reductase [Enterococcus sp. S53]MBK0141872.1 aldo/keto reductase [Enterococcus sp. S76]MBK0145573.1 aldo/keto reductase [Enterococcus sp. S77]